MEKKVRKNGRTVQQKASGYENTKRKKEEELISLKEVFLNVPTLDEKIEAISKVYPGVEGIHSIGKVSKCPSLEKPVVFPDLAVDSGIFRPKKRTDPIYPVQENCKGMDSHLFFISNSAVHDEEIPESLSFLLKKLIVTEELCPNLSANEVWTQKLSYSSTPYGIKTKINNEEIIIFYENIINLQAAQIRMMSKEISSIKSTVQSLVDTVLSK